MNALIDFFSNKDYSIYVYVAITWFLVNLSIGIWRIWQLSNRPKVQQKNADVTEIEAKKSDPKLSDADYLTAEMQQLSANESVSNVWLAAAEQGQIEEDKLLDKEVLAWRHSLERLIEIKKIVDEKAEELVVDMSYTPGRTLHSFFKSLETLIQKGIEKSTTSAGDNESFDKRTVKQINEKPLPFIEELKKSASDRSQNSSDSDNAEMSPKKKDDEVVEKKSNQTPTSKIPKSIISSQTSSASSVFTAKSIIQQSQVISFAPNISHATNGSKSSSDKNSPNYVYMDELRERISQRSTPENKAKWSPSLEKKQELCVGGPLKSAQNSGSKLPVRGEKKKEMDSPNEVAEYSIFSERVHKSFEDYVVDSPSQSSSKALEQLFKKLD